MSKQKINTRIKMVREELGYTQEQFAEILALSLSGYKKLERGEVNLTLDKVYILNQRLGLSADYILFDETAQLSDVWMEICKLPDLDKCQMLMRLYAYLSRKWESELKMDELIKRVDKTVIDFFK